MARGEIMSSGVMVNVYHYICQFLFCKYFMENFKLPIWFHWTESGEDTLHMNNLKGIDISEVYFIRKMLIKLVKMY